MTTEIVFVPIQDPLGELCVQNDETFINHIPASLLTLSEKEHLQAYNKIVGDCYVVIATVEGEDVPVKIARNVLIEGFAWAENTFPIGGDITNVLRQNFAKVTEETVVGIGVDTPLPPVAASMS